MPRRVLLTLVAALCTLTVACTGDDGSDPDDATPRDVSMRTDATLADMGPERDQSVEPDGEVEPDMTVDMTVDPDMRIRVDRGMPREIDSCEDACDRFAECERLDEFGDYDGCLDACTRASRGGPPQGFFTCLELEDNCGLIRLCDLPEPAPLTCEAVCDGLATCEVDLPFPDCLAECEAQNALDDGDPGPPRFSACGEEVVMGCDPDGWWDCAADRIYTACAQRCTATVACNLERADGCLQDCIGERFADDPLARRRAEQRTQCVRFSADDCVRLDACLNPQAAPVFNEQQFCQRWDACFGEFGFPCDEALFFEEQSPGFLACADAELRQGCDGNDPFFMIEQCFDGGGGQLGPNCPELCEARAICGDLPAGQNQQACLVQCSTAIQNGGEGADRQRALFPCGVAQTCDELFECLGDNSPASACEAHCAALDGCGLGDPACQATCDAEFFRARRIGYRDCVSDAGDDCEAVTACDLGEPIGCDLLCERYAVCNNPGANCLQDCDDESYATPRVAEARLACALEAPLCFRASDSIDRCQFDERNAGTACLGWCRAQTGCDPDDVDGLVDCLTACGEGLRDIDGERFAAARPCLERVDVRGACAAIEACIPDEPLDCPAWCDPLGDCDAGPADCAAVCAADPLARLRQAEQRECLGEADGACAEVIECVAAEDGVFDPAGFCADFRACGLEDFFGECEFFIEDFAREPGTLECAAELLDPCPPDPFIIFELCFEQPGGGGGAFDACVGLCQARARCEGLDGSIRDCVTTCVDEVERRPDEFEAAMLPCGGALTCDAYEACRAANDPATACDDHCAALDACGVMPEGCGETCAADFFRDRQIGWRQCVVQAEGDCAAIAACAPQEPHGCVEQCARLADCGLAGQDCVADCDDAQYENPPAAQRTLACVVSAPLCTLGNPSVSRCRNTPQVDGGACLAWCRAETACDPTAGEALADCVVACGEGFIGDDGLRFAAARDCLDGVDPQGACAAIDACIAPEPAVDCPGWCAPLAACDLAPGECDATCPEDELARLRASTQPACFAEAGDDCDGVQACLDPQDEPGEVLDRALICDRYDACGIEFEVGIGCEELIFEFGFDEATLLCFQRNLEVCPDDPFFILNVCLEGGGDPGVPNLAECQALCHAQGRCGRLPGSIRDCAETCVDTLRQRPAGPQADLLPCRFALDCDGLDACLTANGPAGQCAEVCDAAVDCGAFPAEAACLDRCTAQLLEPFVPQGYLDGVAACLDALDPAACPAEGAACFDIQRGDCEATCQAIIDCGLNDGGDIGECVFGCENDPQAAVIIECAERHLIDVCDVDSLFQCVEDAGFPI